MAERGWQREFDDPIMLDDGRVLTTLLDAGHYVAGLPKALAGRTKEGFASRPSVELTQAV